jgi:hypothetical protein
LFQGSADEVVDDETGEPARPRAQAIWYVDAAGAENLGPRLGRFVAGSVRWFVVPSRAPAAVTP